MTPRPPEEAPPDTAVHGLALLVAGLMAGASGVGLLRSGIYRDNALVTAAWRGNDVVTLALGVPVLLGALRASLRGSRRGRLVMLGMLLYALYGYAFYLFGAAFNSLFLVYVAIVAAAGWGLLLGLAGLRDPGAGLRSGTAARSVGVFMVAVGTVLGAFWVAVSVGFLFTGEPPAMLAATDHPTNVTGALDLSVIVSLALVGGVLVARRRPWGYALAVIWNVSGAVYMLALTGAAFSAYLAGAASDLTQVALWLPIGLGCALATAALLVRPAPGGVPWE